MTVIAAVLMLAAQDDRIDSAIWYTRQTSQQVEKLSQSVDKLNDRIGALVEDSVTARGRVERLEDRVSRHEGSIAEYGGAIRSLELWRSESVGKFAILGSALAAVMGLAMSAFNRIWAKRDKQKGRP